MNSMQLRAPAKVNLSFRIIARRPDGFHEIETLMAPISLCDEITLTRTKGSIEVKVDDPTLPSGEDNLAVRAARLFLVKTGLRVGLAIDLRKIVTHGAGLGGGSSDAAAVLLGLNRMLGAGIEVRELAALGAEIGSDVPLFVFESAAVCR